MKAVSAVLQKFFFALIMTIFVVSATAAQGVWNMITRGGSGDLVSVYFTSSDRGWIGGDGGYLAMTNDGGRSWQRQPLNGTDNINEIYFRNDDNGYILAGKRIYLTKDGGKSWRENVNR